MSSFIHRGDGLERELRSSRPRPSDELVSRIEARVAETAPRRRSLRLVVPVALTMAVVAALAAVGGVGYAASSIKGAADAVAHAFGPAKQHSSIVISGISSGSDQYKPGYGFGDPNHTHTGPPGLKNGKGAFAPPALAKISGKYAFVTTSFTIDTQAHLYIHVLDQTTGKELNIVQNRSKIGQGVHGVPAKTINYLVLIPRKIPIHLAIPANLLLPGHSYAVWVQAKSPNGNKSQVKLPFKA